VFTVIVCTTAQPRVEREAATPAVAAQPEHTVAAIEAGHVAKTAG